MINDCPYTLILFRPSAFDKYDCQLLRSNKHADRIQFSNHPQVGGSASVFAASFICLEDDSHILCKNKVDVEGHSRCSHQTIEAMPCYHNNFYDIENVRFLIL